MAKAAKKSKWEGSKADKAMDKAEKKAGIKEGSKKDEAIDRLMSKKKKGKK